MIATSTTHAQSTTDYADAVITNEDPIPGPPPKPAKRLGNLNFGVGYDSIVGLAGHLSMGYDKFLGIPDLHVAFGAQHTDFQSSAHFGLVGPFTRHSPWFWTASVHRDQSRLARELDLQVTSNNLHLGVGRALGKHWRVSTGLRSASHRTLGGGVLLDNAPTSFDGLALDPGRLLQAAWFEVEHRAENNPTGNFLQLPTGLHMVARLERSSSSLGSDYTYTHASLRASVGVDMPLGTHLLMTGRVGAANTPSADQMPLMDRYRLGTVHAFGGLMMPALGPTIDGTTAPLGGSAGAYGRAELSVPLWQRIGLHAFGGVEGGGIGQNLLETDTLSAGATVFGGVKWQSPIGPMRVAWGSPIAAPDQQPPLFVFQLGQAF